MKYLVLLAVVIDIVWWLRQSGRANATGKSPASPESPQDMVACTHCRVHVPRSDAVVGASGLYCCAEHRQQHEA